MCVGVGEGMCYITSSHLTPQVTVGNFRAEIGEFVIESTGDDNNVVIYAIIALIIVILFTLVVFSLIAFAVYRWRVRKGREDKRLVQIPN